MIVVRDIFQVKFGQAKDAIGIWKEGMSLMKRLTDGKTELRLLSDLAGGPYYTLVVEFTQESISAWEQLAPTVMGSNEWKTWYQKLIPLVDSGRREIMNVVA